MNTRIWITRAAVIGSSILAVWVGTISYQSFQRAVTINAEIAKLETQAREIDQENATLREKIDYFASPSFQEREAKEKLGLRRAGEQVAIVHSLSENEARGDIAAVLPGTLGRIAEFHSPNYYKWWKILFDNPQAR